MNGDLKMTFIENVLRQYMDDVKATMRIALRRQNVGVTESLLHSIASRVLSEVAGAHGELLFDESGRFVDMGVGKGHKLGGLKATRAALRAAPPAGGGGGVRKPKKIYSRIAYGKLNHLMNELLHGYTEETVAMLKKEMTNGTALN